MTDGFEPDPPTSTTESTSFTTGSHPSAHLRPVAEPVFELLDGGSAGSSADPDAPLSSVFPAGAALPDDVVSYGPDIADESAFRLLGSLDGKRVLELGAGGGALTVAMARQGAHVITVDPSLARIETVRLACERAEVKAELHQSDLAELAFIRADQIDVALAVYSLAGVDDLDRVFRQVHRVLKTSCHLVISLPHPAFDVARSGSYFDNAPVPYAGGVEHPRTISEVFTSLSRANFRVDTLLEPQPVEGPRSALWNDHMAEVPATLIIRGRKEGL